MENKGEQGGKSNGEDKPVPRGKVSKILRDEMGRLTAHVYVSIRTKEGKEIHLFKSLAELEGSSRTIAEEELRDKVFNPKIERVLECKHEFGITSIEAVTDRGEVSFQIRSRDDVRVLSANRALFKDVDGNTYELPDLSALDPASQKHFQDYF